MPSSNVESSRAHHVHLQDEPAEISNRANGHRCICSRGFRQRPSGGHPQPRQGKGQMSQREQTTRTTDSCIINARRIVRLGRCNAGKTLSPLLAPPLSRTFFESRIQIQGDVVRNALNVQYICSGGSAGRRWSGLTRDMLHTVYHSKHTLPPRKISHQRQSTQTKHTHANTNTHIHAGFAPLTLVVDDQVLLVALLLQQLEEECAVLRRRET